MTVNDLFSVYLFFLAHAVKLHIKQYCFPTVFGCQNVIGYVSALTTTSENRLQGLAAASDYGTLWIFLLTFFTTLCCWWNKKCLINDFYKSRNRHMTQTNL